MICKLTSIAAIHGRYTIRIGAESRSADNVAHMEVEQRRNLIVCQRWKTVSPLSRE